eukprot:m.88906 g.88906  ORF g.88906 m.88906 type:complete len:61 (+) comp8819_c0_seq1:155-337(+)
MYKSSPFHQQYKDLLMPLMHFHMMVHPSSVFNATITKLREEMDGSNRGKTEACTPGCSRR